MTDPIAVLLDLVDRITDPVGFKKQLAEWIDTRNAAEKAKADLTAHRKDTEAKVAKAQADLAKSQQDHDAAAAEVGARIQVGNDQINRLEAMQKDHEERELNLTRIEDKLRSDRAALDAELKDAAKRKIELDVRQANLAKREARLKEALS